MQWSHLCAQNRYTTNSTNFSILQRSTTQGPGMLPISLSKKHIFKMWDILEHFVLGWSPLKPINLRNLTFCGQILQSRRTTFWFWEIFTGWSTRRAFDLFHPIKIKRERSRVPWKQSRDYRKFVVLPLLLRNAWDEHSGLSSEAGCRH